MKKVLMSVVALIISLSANTALACSYRINEAKKNAELKEVALASLSDAKIISAVSGKLFFFESKPTPMCPDEMTYNTTVDVTYSSGLNTCVVQLEVKKVESWTDEVDQDTYTVSGRNKARCSK